MRPRFLAFLAFQLISAACLAQPDVVVPLAPYILETWMPTEVPGNGDIIAVPPSTSTPGPPPIAPHDRADLPVDVATLVAGNNRFGLNIYQQLSAAKPDQNVLVSPFSISAAFAMTYAGARGRTAQQMGDVLGYTLPDDQLHPAFGSLLSDLTATRDGYQLNVANRLFGQAGYPFHKPFLDTTGKNYGAPLEPTDFAGDPEGARKRINDWVAGQTHDKIKELMPGGSVTSDTALVLTNAMYFKGDWKNKFDTENTRDDSFFGPAGVTTQASMMRQEHSFGYAERPGFQMLEMPYAGDDLSMVVVLPTERDGLAALESSLTQQILDESLASLYSTTVNVSFPKFTFNSKFKLGSTLTAMGMTDAFDPIFADFSGMADDSLAIDDAYHNTFIAVNEEGTEAAAATAVAITTTTCVCPPPQPKIFDADHPFLFALRDLHSGSLLFLGRVVDPGQEAFGDVAQVPEPASAMLCLLLAIGTGISRHTRFSSRCRT